MKYTFSSGSDFSKNSFDKPFRHIQFLSYLIANAPDGLFGYLQEINGCYSIPILTIIVVGYLTKKVPSIAANIAILSGAILYFISQFVLKFYFETNALDLARESGVTDESALALVKANAYPHFLLAILFVFNVLLMLVIGKFYPRKESYELVYTNQVDITPWKYSNISVVAVVLIVIWTYIYFN